MPESMKKEKTLKKEKNKQLKPATNSGKYTSPLKDVSKVSKKLLKDIGKIPKMSTDDMEKYLQAIALGIIPDRFGMEPSLDTKVNAIKVLKELKFQEDKSKGENEEQKQIDVAANILTRIKESTKNEEGDS